MASRNFDPDIVIINVNGIKEKIDLKKAFILDNVIPSSINAFLSVLPNLYSRWGNIKVELNAQIEIEQEKFENWKAEKIDAVCGDRKFSSESARMRELRNSKFGARYTEFSERIRELSLAKARAEIVRKGFKMQSFTIREQVDLIQSKTGTKFNREEDKDPGDNFSKSSQSSKKRRKKS